MTEDQDMSSRQVAIVTGTASPNGIGWATSIALARRGVAIGVVDIARGGANPELIAAVEAEGGVALAVEADVSDAASVARMVSVVEAELGPVGTLVNNAGITQAVPFMEMTEDDWDRIMRINLKSGFLCAQAVSASMRKRGGGAIVGISSLAGRDGGSGFGGVHYATSKAGIIGFTRALAREVAPHNIRVNAIAPGSIETDIMSGLSTRSGQDNDAYRQERISRTPLGRLGGPEEIANAVVYLALDAHFVTGVVLDVNGGRFIG
jgi:NAD(P)-dependent dehydrogenase (short-subunit alcohol dehydrogenase family)